jgi:hypothetical protein
MKEVEELFDDLKRMNGRDSESEILGFKFEQLLSRSQRASVIQEKSAGARFI